MYILYQLDSGGTWSIYRYTQGHGCARHTSFGGLEHALSQVLRDKRDDEAITILMDESAFGYHTFLVSFVAEEPYEISTYKTLIADKVTELDREHGLRGPYVFHRLADIHADGEPVDKILGKTGRLAFRLQFGVLGGEATRLIKSIGGEKLLDELHGAIYPKSYFILDHLHRELDKGRVLLLVMEREKSSLIQVEGGFYRQVDTIDLGMSALKQLYADQGVEKFFFANHLREANSMVNRLVDEAVEFFVGQLIKRVGQWVEPEDELFMISQLADRAHVMEQFVGQFREHCQGHLLPLGSALTDHERGDEVMSNIAVAFAASALS